MLLQVLYAIYTTLTSNPDLLERVPENQIRRGWQEPVDIPTVRFYLASEKTIGDDNDRSRSYRIDAIVTVLDDNDWNVIRIARSVINAMKLEAMSDDSIIFHNVIYKGDRRGTYFDVLRKVYRKDLVFEVIFTAADAI